MRYGGTPKKTNAMSDKFKDIILDHNYVDICPPKISPTWDNGRTGNGYKAKHLDGFLIHEDLVDRLGSVQFGIMSNFILDHRPIFLFWQQGGGSPFWYSIQI